MRIKLSCHFLHDKNLKIPRSEVVSGISSIVVEISVVSVWIDVVSAPSTSVDTSELHVKHLIKKEPSYL